MQFTKKSQCTTTHKQYFSKGSGRYNKIVDNFGKKGFLMDWAADTLDMMNYIHTCVACALVLLFSRLFNQFSLPSSWTILIQNFWSCTDAPCNTCLIAQLGLAYRRRQRNLHRQQELLLYQIVAHVDTILRALLARRGQLWIVGPLKQILNKTFIWTFTNEQGQTRFV